MKYKLLVFDFDGTVRPTGEERITRPVADALNAVQAAGVKLAVATGRCRGALPPKLLRGVKPDYFICANGAQVETRLGERLYADTMGRFGGQMNDAYRNYNAQNHAISMRLMEREIQ